MPWPLASAYAKMLQNPPVAFKDPELRKCTIKRDEHGQPKVASGQFAVVYKATLQNGQHMAVRAFTSDKGGERNERYHLISEHLRQHRNVRSLVGFDYCEKGIRADDGKLYPLVTMEWVSGVELFHWVRTKCIDRETQRLSQAVDHWTTLISELADSQIAHGDLQHGNVMVTDQDEFKLVDYDCMCVPTLVGRPNLEIGVEPYQHPDRDANTQLSLQLDNFSAIFILVAFRALAATPGLWDEYVEKPRYDKLLFRKEDFSSPTTSSLYQTLLHSRDTELGRQVNDLFEIYRSPINGVPALRQFVFSFDQVRSLLSRKAWDEAVALLNRHGATKDVPADLQPKVKEAFDRVHCRTELEKQVQAGDEAGMCKYYNARLLDDYPAALPAVQVAKFASVVLQLLQQLQAARQQQHWRDLVRIWDTQRPLLESRKSPDVQRFRTEADDWRQRNQLCDEVLSLLRQPACDVARLAPAWDRLNQLRGHPDTDRQRSQIQKRVDQGRAWSAFEQLPRQLCQDHDQHLVSAWNEALFAGWDVAERQRPVKQAAEQRLQGIATLSRAVQQALQPTPAGERDLLQLATALPAGYQLQAELQGRIQTARDRLDTFQRLQAVLAAQTSEKEIAAVGGELTRLQLRNWLDPPATQRVALAEQRVPVLTQLAQIPRAGPPDEQDRRLLACWKKDLLDDCPEAQSWRAAYQNAVRRKTLVGRLEQAVGESDDQLVADLTADPLLANYPLPAKLQEQIRAIREGVEGARAILNALRDDDHEAFREAFDTDILRRYRKLFTSQRGALTQHIKEEILPAEKLGLLPHVLRSLVREGNVFKARWQWPKRRITDQCYIGICRVRPEAADVPFQVALPNSLNQVTRNNYEQAGGRKIHADPCWNHAYVVVWAWVDVDFQKFHSEPLILGRIDLDASPDTSRHSRSKK